MTLKIFNTVTMGKHCCLLLFVCLVALNQILGQSVLNQPESQLPLQHLELSKEQQLEAQEQKVAQQEQPALTKNEWLIYTKVDKCSASSTFPSIGSNGVEEFAADNAARKGSGYWSSEGNHKKEDIVNWTGSMRNRRTIKGIEIHWAYAPGKVSILGSYDGKEPFHRLTDFQSVTSKNASFVQQIFFNNPVREKSIRIEMQDPVHEYFGINFVQFIVGNSVVRIQSGITSPFQDMCLVADESNEIVLDGCLESLAAMDGRDFWIFNSQGQIVNPIKNSCMVLKDNNNADGGTIILDDCFVAYNHHDGRSIWELQKNNQLKLMKGGNLCLSQKGTKSGSSDVALNKQLITSHPRIDDPHHGPEMAVDGKADTYWASLDFPLNVVPDAVYLDINLGDKYKLKTVTIDWVYPAMSYEISISEDAKTWNNVVATSTNSLHSTVDNLRSSIAQYIRIAMKKPHPTLSRLGDSVLYGIRTLSVFSNRLKSIIEDCSTAAASQDARDKFFLEMVPEIDLSASDNVRLANAAVVNETKTVMQLSSSIEELLPAANACFNDKKATKEILLSVQESLRNLKEEVAITEQSINEFGTPSKTEKLAYSSEFPAEDCVEIKKKDPRAVSGFFYVRPHCSPSPIRVYCDMTIAATYFVPPDNEIFDIKSTEMICSKFGLTPVQLHTAGQIAGLRTMLNLMGVDLNNPVPIAVDNGNGRYFDTALVLDVTDILMSVHHLIPPSGNTAGIGTNGLVFFDGSATDMSGIICSTNTDVFNQGQSYVEVSCATIMKNNQMFNVPSGETVVVKCPESCLETEYAVIGTDVYNEESSICLAAAHAGAYNKNGFVVISLTQDSNEFIGSNRNGVASESLKTVEKRRAFQVKPLEYICAEQVEKAKSSSFIEITTEQSATEKEEQANDELLNKKTGEAIKNLIMFLNMQYSAVEPSFIRDIQEKVAAVGSNARSIIKPASKLENILRNESMELLLENKEFGVALESIASKINSRMYMANQKLALAMAQQSLLSATKSWSLNEAVNENFYDLFEAKTSTSVVGSGNWHYADSFKQSTMHNIIAQTSSVVPIDPSAAAIGTFLKLRNKNFFDFVFTADVYMGEPGSIGLAFRMKDWNNMYLFEMTQNLYGGFKRLLRIENGRPVETARLDDGGFLTGLWYTIRIETQQSRIKISAVKTYEEAHYTAPEPLIDIVDGVFVSGTVGLFTSSSSQAYFDAINILPVPCVRDDVILTLPRPPRCSNFKESFTGSFTKVWDTIEPDDSHNGPSEWKYSENVGGQRNVLVQMSSVMGIEDSTPSLAVLKKHRSCDKGVIEFSFFPQCEAGIIGGIFNYKNSHNYNIFELGPTFARLRRNANGQFSTYATSILNGYKLSSWNKVKVILHPKRLIIQTGEAKNVLFDLIGMPSECGGSVGVSSYNCPGVAFANITVYPNFDENDEVATQMPVTVVKPETSGMEVCLKKNVVERFNYCRSAFSKSGSFLRRCKLNFCDTCCDQEFSVSSKARVTCKNHCHEGDHISNLSESALLFLENACAIDETNKFYETCNSEEDKDACFMQLCSMCCRTVKLPSSFDQSYGGKLLLAKECEDRCLKQQLLSTEFEEL